MAKPVPEEELGLIEGVVRRHPEGITAREISNTLSKGVPLRTLQYRLKSAFPQP